MDDLSYVLLDSIQDDLRLIQSKMNLIKRVNTLKRMDTVTKFSEYIDKATQPLNDALFTQPIN